MLQQMPLTILPPSLSRSLRVREDAPFSMSLPIGQEGAGGAVKTPATQKPV